MFSLSDKKMKYELVLVGKRAARKFRRNFQNKDRVKKMKLRNHDDYKNQSFICWTAKVPRFELKIWVLLENPCFYIKSSLNTSFFSRTYGPRYRVIY